MYSYVRRYKLRTALDESLYFLKNIDTHVALGLVNRLTKS